MPTIKPAKLKSGEWGINTFDVPELERGQMVRVHTRESSYIAIIRNLVFMGQHDETGKKVAYYGISRLNEDGCCPACGTEVDIDEDEIIDHGKPNYQDREDEDEKPRQRASNGNRGGNGNGNRRKSSAPKNRATKRAEPQDDLDDDIPF